MIPGAVTGVVVLVSVLVLISRDGGRSNGGTCLTDLSAHLPRSETVVYGTDLVQARGAGYVDDGTLEQLGSSQAETGALPDALSQRYRYGQLLTTDAFTARTGVKPQQIQCSLSDARRSVLSGSFDVAEVSGSSVADEGRLAAAPHRLGFTTSADDPAGLLEPRNGGGLSSNEAVERVIEALRADGSYSILVQVGTSGGRAAVRAAGLGVAEGSGDGKALVVAWAFGTDAAATAGRADIADRVNLALRGTSSITPEDLRVDGSLVRARIATRRAPDLKRVLNTSPDLIPGNR